MHLSNVMSHRNLRSDDRGVVLGLPGAGQGPITAAGLSRVSTEQTLRHIAALTYRLLATVAVQYDTPGKQAQHKMTPLLTNFWETGTANARVPTAAASVLPSPALAPLSAGSLRLHYRPHGPRTHPGALPLPLTLESGDEGDGDSDEEPLGFGDTGSSSPDKTGTGTKGLTSLQRLVLHRIALYA